MQTLTYDKIAGINAPIGQITGFPKPRIKANWPTRASGKLLTDARIAYYQKKGYYGSNGILALSKKQTAEKHIAKQKTLSFRAQMRAKYK